jgi:hypothetical protein
MISLLVLSLALSAPATAVQAPTAPNDPLGASSQPLAQVQPEMPMKVEPETAGQFDTMETHPDSDICYKIRAFIFSQGTHPKLLRETTCGPKAPTTKSIEIAKPKLLPLDATDKQAASQQK